MLSDHLSLTLGILVRYLNQTEVVFGNNTLDASGFSHLFELTSQKQLVVTKCFFSLSKQKVMHDCAIMLKR